jgi:hypothetical protein
MGIGNPHGYPDYTWPMVWVLQDGELWPIEQWVAHQGEEKHFFAEANVAAGSPSPVTLYTVPANKKLYVVGYTSGAQVKGYHSLFNGTTSVYYKAFWIPAYGSQSVAISPPVTLTAGQALKAQRYNFDAVDGTFTVTAAAYELNV